MTQPQLYNIYTFIRIDGTIQGELRDEEQEKVINELKLEAEQWKLKYEQVKSENKTLANELYDAQNIIATYEQPITKNRDDK